MMFRNAVREWFQETDSEDSNKTHLSRESRRLHGSWRGWLPWPSRRPLPGQDHGGTATTLPFPPSPSRGRQQSCWGLAAGSPVARPTRLSVWGCALRAPAGYTWTTPVMAGTRQTPDIAAWPPSRAPAGLCVSGPRGTKGEGHTSSPGPERDPRASQAGGRWNSGPVHFCL